MPKVIKHKNEIRGLDKIREVLGGKNEKKEGENNKLCVL